MKITDQNGSPSKQTNRLQHRMHSTRKCVQEFWRAVSQRYSKFLIRFSWVILGTSFLISMALIGCFLILFNIRSFDQNNFISAKSEAIQNAQRLKEIFGKDTQLRSHQHLQIYPNVDIIIKRRHHSDPTNEQSNNMLHTTIVNEVTDLNY